MALEPAGPLCTAPPSPRHPLRGLSPFRKHNPACAATSPRPGPEEALSATQPRHRDRLVLCAGKYLFWFKWTPFHKDHLVVINNSYFQIICLSLGRAHGTHPNRDLFKGNCKWAGFTEGWGRDGVRCGGAGKGGRGPTDLGGQDRAGPGDRLSSDLVQGCSCSLRPPTHQRHRWHRSLVGVGLVHGGGVEVREGFQEPFSK